MYDCVSDDCDANSLLGTSESSIGGKSNRSWRFFFPQSPFCRTDAKAGEGRQTNMFGQSLVSVTFPWEFTGNLPFNRPGGANVPPPEGAVPPGTTLLSHGAAGLDGRSLNFSRASKGVAGVSSAFMVLGVSISCDDPPHHEINGDSRDAPRPNFVKLSFQFSSRVPALVAVVLMWGAPHVDAPQSPLIYCKLRRVPIR